MGLSLSYQQGCQRTFVTKRKRGLLIFQELAVFEDLNIFYSQEECVSLDPTQQPTSEKEEDSVGEMMLMGKELSLLCVQIEWEKHVLLLHLRLF